MRCQKREPFYARAREKRGSTQSKGKPLAERAPEEKKGGGSHLDISCKIEKGTGEGQSKKKVLSHSIGEKEKIPLFHK